MTPLLLALLLLAADPQPLPNKPPAIRVLNPTATGDAPAEKTTLTVGRFRALYLESQAADILWVVTPRDAANASVKFRILKPGTMIFGWIETGSAAELHEFPATASDILYLEGVGNGVVTVSAYTNGEKKPKLVAEQLVAVGKPGPPPPPPAPSDPLFQAVAAAFMAESPQAGFDKKADAAALANSYRTLAQVGVNTATTAEQLAQVVAASRAQAVANRLPNVRGVFGGEFNKVLPAEPTSVLTADQKAAAVALFARFAGLLDALK